ncbi:MAG: phosphoesterase, partial [Hyphomicrobiales bacterium]|nr:phosphoesterase [Hyphomicrobiales bacterium]
MPQTTVTTSFSGISDPTNWPPENGLAVGPAYVVMVESSKIEWTNLTGGAAFNESLYTLFGSLSASQRNSLLDARVAYDSVNGRFVVMAMNLGTNESNIDIAVSKDSNPNDGWYVGSVSSLLTINGAVTQADMPYLSVDGNNIYVSEPQYGSGLQGTQEWVFGDTAGSGGGIYNGGTLTTLASQVAPPSAGIARNVSNGQGLTYYVSVVPTGGQSVLTIQTYNSATNAFSAATTLALGNSDKGASSSDYTIAQEGTSLTLDAYDSRIASLAYSNGFLYGLSEVENVGTSIPEIHWFKLNVSNPGAPTIAAQGDITGAAIGAGVGVFNASLAVDAAGDMIVNFNASSANMFPADYYMVMPSGSSSFGSPTLYQSSTSFYAQTTNASGAQRWGTYSTAIADPNDPNGFWISNEYVTSSGITIPSGLSAWWDTVTAQVHVSPTTPPPPPVAPSITAPANGSTITTTADPTISGSGISGDTVTVSIDGTSVGTTTVASSSWSFTPTTALSNASHSVTATQAAAGG